MRETINIDCKHIWNAIQRLRESNSNMNTVENEIARVISKYGVEQKHGHWEWQTEDIYRCSECGEDIQVKEVMNIPQYVCCPMCMAAMDEVSE